jgi:membrane-bound ClpP family serine protease
MNKRLTSTRLILAIISTGLEEAAIWAVWRWALPGTGVDLPLFLLIIMMIAWAVLSICLFIFTTRALKRQVQAGLPSMVGTGGKAASRLAPKGMVKIRGELWGAIAEGDTINTGEDILVIEQKGLKLIVRRIHKDEVKR